MDVLNRLLLFSVSGHRMCILSCHCECVTSIDLFFWRVRPHSCAHRHIHTHTHAERHRHRHIYIYHLYRSLILIYPFVLIVHHFGLATLTRSLISLIEIQSEFLSYQSSSQDISSKVMSDWISSLCQCVQNTSYRTVEWMFICLINQLNYLQIHTVEEIELRRF